MFYTDGADQQHLVMFCLLTANSDNSVRQVQLPESIVGNLGVSAAELRFSGVKTL